MNRQTQLRAVEQEEPPGTEKTGGGNGGGRDLEERLRGVEIQLAEIRAKLDAELKHFATKAWVLGGVLAGMGVAATIAAAIVLTALRVFAAK